MKAIAISAYRIAVSLLFMGLFLLTTAVVQAQSSEKGQSVFTEWRQTQYAEAPVRYTWPEKFKAYSYHLSSLRQILKHAPMEFTPGAQTSFIVFDLPMPNGEIAKFKVVETETMDPVLAAKFPGLKTYSGQGITDPASVLKLTVSDYGLWAMVLSNRGNVFVDPLEHGNTTDVVVYSRKDLKPYSSFVCETGEKEERFRSAMNYTAIGAGQLAKSHGTTLRTYRLALACTGEYAAFHGGTTAGAMAGMVATMNRVNGVYETEVAVHMTMVANNNLLIYLNGTTDPYTNNNGGTMLTENINNCNTVIGSANYDIGHVFSTGGGGVAYLGVPCTTNKAGGVTGSSSPVNDAFDIDYVAHEMGHQFGAHHTFNSSTGSCSGNRTAAAAFEPGSGITIMAYAGICTATNDLAPHSIAYFHTYSFDQITTYITTGSGNSCAVATATGNTPPTVVPDALNYTIPYQTPFTLNATGSDANGDALTYSWEEYDLGAAGNWNAPVGDAPIFRPFDPVVSGSRTFPKISDIVNNTTTIGELLPTYARTLKFRVTVRDNRAGGGGVMHPDDTVRVNVINTGAAFAVTAPNTAVTWTSGQPATVTWNVSNTDISPISCANVAILLSTDGGYTYPVTILSATPNDGSEIITVPANITTTARIKVQAVGNIFFDISNTNFTIQSGSSVLSVLNTNPVTTSPLCAGQTLSVGYTGDGPANAGNVFTAQLSNSAGSFASPVVIGTLGATAASGTISCTIPGGTVQGTGYRIRVISSNPAITGTDNATNLTIQNTVGAAGLVSGTSTVCQGQTGLAYSVSAVSNATNYTWSLPAGFTITSDSGTNAIVVTASAAAVSGNISVTPSNGCFTGAGSAAFAVTVSPLPSAAGSISGTATVCPGLTGVVYTVPAIANATSYNWTLPSGATIASGAGTNSITVDFSVGAVTGNISVAGANTCGSGTSSVFFVTVQSAAPVPVISASGSTSFCTPGSVTLSFTPVAGVQYQWRKNGVNIAGETGASYVATASGNYDVIASIIPVGQQTFNSTGSVSIPDNSCTGGSSNITVSGYNVPVRSSDIYINMNIRHTYVGDLDIFLESPSGARIGISDQTNNVNNGGDNFTNTVIADSGSVQIPTSGAPYTGLYKPWTSTFTVTSCTGLTTTLTSFAGLGSGSLNPNGTWKLRAFDRFSTDVGSITSWSITFPYIGQGCQSVSNAIAISVTAAPVVTGFTPVTGSVGTPVTINGSGFTGATNVAFNGASATFTVVNSNQITTTVPVGATTGNISVSTTCGTVNGPVPFNVVTNATLNITALIEGFYNAGTHLMIPVVGGSVSDSIMVELHQTSSPYSVVYSTQTTLNLAGQTTITLPGAYIGSSYYLVFRHRNAIETWSKNPVLISAVTNFNLAQ